MASEWYCRVLGQEVGPVGFQDMAEMIRSGTLTENDKVRRKGTDQWIRAGDVTGLFRVAKKGSAQATPAAEQAKPASPPAEPKAQTQPSPRPSPLPRRRGKRQVLLAVGMVAGLILMTGLVTAWRSGRSDRFPEPQAGKPRPADGKVLAAGDAQSQYAWDFRQGIDDQNMHLMGGAAHPDLCMATAEGLRFLIPPGQDKIIHSALRLPFRVQGDFQVTVGYTILSMPQGEPGCMVGLKVAVWDVEGQWASIERQHLDEGGESYMTHRAFKEGGNYRHQAERARAGALSGRLRLQRSGSTLRFAVAEGQSDEFIELGAVEFTSDDLADVRLAAQTEGSTTGVDVAWTDLDISTGAPP